MKKIIITDLICLLLIVTVIGIPIAIYLLRKREDYGRTDNILKPSSEVKEKEYEEEKRKFTPLYTETTILPVLTEEDLAKYKKKEEPKKVEKKDVEPKKVEKEKEEPKKEIKKGTTTAKKKSNKKVVKKYYDKKNDKVYYKKPKKQKKKGV